MSASAEPSAEIVDQLLTWTVSLGLPFVLSHDQAVRALQISDNDVNTAVNKLFDQGTAWIEHEPLQVNHGNGDFSQLPYNEHQSGAPTRAPSRNGPLSPAASVGDEPIQSIEGGQESGVTGSFAPVTSFGPANRDKHYEENSWAMVPTVTTTNYVPEAALANRQRQEGQPAFIRPLGSNDSSYLPALLTILHSIPLVRNTLLCPEIQLDDYTVGADWWKGGPYAHAHVVDYESSDGPARDLEIIHEVQRLTAFLDATKRAYGSVDALLQKLGESRHFELDPFVTFLRRWGVAYENQTAEHETANSLHGLFKSTFQVAGQTEPWDVIKLSVVATGPKMSLYDVMDDNFYDMSSDSKVEYIADASNVLVLSVTNANSLADELGCTIPPTLRVEKYLEQNHEATYQSLRELRHYKRQIKSLDDEMNKLKWRTTRKYKKVESLKLLKASMLAFQPSEGDLIENPQHAFVLSRLQYTYEGIERKITELEEQKKKAEDQYREYLEGKLAYESDATAASDEENKSTYTLCGISTRPGVYYIQHVGINSHVPDDKAWMRVEYVPSDSEAFISRESMDIDSVLDKASTEGRTALLVYANHVATSSALLPLSESLQQFVEADNSRFQQELLDENGGWGELDQFNTMEPIGGWDKAAPFQTDHWYSENRAAGLDDMTPSNGDALALGLDNQYQDLPTIPTGNDDISEKYFSQILEDDQSSCTLTPNTDFGSNELSEVEPMDQGVRVAEMYYHDADGEVTLEGAHAQQTATTHTEDIGDVEMTDVEHEHDHATREGAVSPRVQHIERADYRGQ